MYHTLINDSVIYPNKLSWCSLLPLEDRPTTLLNNDLLCSLGFHEEWLFQDVVND